MTQTRKTKTVKRTCPTVAHHRWSPWAPKKKGSSKLVRACEICGKKQSLLPTNEEEPATGLEDLTHPADVRDE